MSTTRASRVGPLFFAFFLLTLAGSAQAQPVAVEPPYHIGILLPLSGEYEHVGAQLLEALQLGLDDTPGLTWSVADTRGNPDTAAQLVRDLASNPAAPPPSRSDLPLDAFGSSTTLPPSFGFTVSSFSWTSSHSYAASF